MRSITGLIFIFLAALMNPLSANQVENQGDFAQISSRKMPVEDLQLLNEQRAKVLEMDSLLGDEEGAESLVLDDDSDEEEGLVEVQEVNKGLLRASTSTLLSKKGSIINGYYDYSGTNHWITFFSSDSRIVELEDESQWLILVQDLPRASRWLSGQFIAIYPNKDFFFKTTNYKLTNLNNGDTINVDLIRGPSLNSFYTKYITAVDLINDCIYLNDGSRWDVAWSDSAVTRQCMPNDVVIIGSNYGLFTCNHPSILINVSLNQYVAVKRAY